MIEVIALQFGKLDLASPAGKLMLNMLTMLTMLTMLAAVAEMERDLLVERTQARLARAKAQGKTLGRPITTSAEQREKIRHEYKQGVSVSALARSYGISRPIIHRIARDSAE